MPCKICMIDGSHMRVTEFQYRVIRHAKQVAGLTLDADDSLAYDRAGDDAMRLVSELSTDDAEALGWIEDAAIEALCDWGGSWWIDESCLWFERDEDASEQQAACDDYWSKR